jgi:IS30 family transposase
LIEINEDFQLMALMRRSEFLRHAAPRLTLAADVDVYFCDPHAPWQRGLNENTNRLLRQ